MVKILDKSVMLADYHFNASADKNSKSRALSHYEGKGSGAERGGGREQRLSSNNEMCHGSASHLVMPSSKPGISENVCIILS